MGIFTKAAMKAAGVGWPNVGWAPPAGWSGDSIAATVNQNTAMGVGAFTAGIRLIAEDIASMPLITYERLERGKRRAPEHPAYAMLHDSPNPEMTSMVFRETGVAHLYSWGNWYAEKELNGLGVPARLWPLRPDRMTVEMDAGKRVYKYRLPDGSGVIIPAERMFHVPGWGFDGLVGYSRVTLMRRALESSIVATEYGLRTLANDARPGVTITHPQQLAPAAKKNIAESWDEAHKGLTNAQRTAVLDEGMTIEHTGFSPEDAQFLESKQWSLVEVAQGLRLAPHKLSDFTRATFCLPGDELVLTEHGPRPIRDVTPGTNVWSRGEAGMVLSPVTATALSGYDRVLTVRTTNRTLRVTAGHRVLARRRSRIPGVVGAMVGQGKGSNPATVRWTTEWTEAGTLAIGDTLVTLDSLPSAGTRHAPTRPNVSVGFMEFCGLLVGDGNVTIATGKPVGMQIARAATALYMDHYRDVIRREFVAMAQPSRWRTGKTRPVHVQEGQRQTVVRSVLAGEELEFLGFCGTARTKRVPGWVFGLAPDLRLAFLRGYLDADGTVDKLGRISFSSAGRLLLEDIRHLCIGLGIPVTNVRSYRAKASTVNGRPVAPTGDQHTFTCSDPGANRRVGSHDPRYVARLRDGREFGRKGRAYPDFGGPGFAEPGLSLSRIVAIGEDQLAQPVYDLQVAGTASFVASGVMVHNSNIEEANIDHVVGTLGPPCVRIEQQIGKDILGPGRFFAEHLQDALMRGKTLDRFAAYRIATNGAAWMNADDVAEIENRNPLPDGKGQIYLAPLNSSPVELLAEAVLGKDGEPPEFKPDPMVEVIKALIVGQAALAKGTDRLAGLSQRPITLTSPEISIEPATVNVAAPTVNVAPAAVTIAPPTVNITIPAAKTTRKTVQRDKAGLITGITETEE